jgi:RHS repeat-associated protein
LQDELGLGTYAMDFRQYDPAIARWVVQDPVMHHNVSPYNAFDNNPVFWKDPSGADSIYNDATGKYVINGKEVSFEEAMSYANAGGNSDGKNNNQSAEDPPAKKGKGETPINWFKKGYGLGQAGSLYEVANKDKKALKGVVVLYAHATDTWIQGPNGEQINNVEELNVILSKYSSQWRDFYKSKNGKLTLVIKACNAGNEEGGDGITNKLNVGRNFTHDKKGLTIIAASGFYLTSPNFLSRVGIDFEVGVSRSSLFTDGTWNVYYNGSLINKFND